MTALNKITFLTLPPNWAATEPVANALLERGIVSLDERHFVEKSKKLLRIFILHARQRDPCSANMAVVRKFIELEFKAPGVVLSHIEPSNSEAFGQALVCVKAARGCWFSDPFVFLENNLIPKNIPKGINLEAIACKIEH